MQLLISAMKLHHDSDNISSIKKLAHQKNIDWQLFFSLTYRHKVYPRVWRNLITIVPDIFTEETIEDHKARFRTHTMHCMAITGQLYKVCELLNKQNIIHTPYKGPVLAAYLYGNINMRSFSDLDILISEKDLQQVYKLLITNGYRPEFDITEQQITAYTLTEDNLAFLPNDQGVPVEIHWELSGRYLATPWGLDHVSRRLSTVEVQGKEFPLFSSENLLIYFCLHGTKHEWKQLDLISCLAELIMKEKKISWPMVFEMADDLKCRRMVYIGLLLALKTYMIDVPETILAELKADKKALLLSERVYDNLHNLAKQKERASPPGHDSRFSLFRFQARDSLIDATLYLLRIIFYPSKAEWMLFKLPSGLTFGYWIARPFRILWATTTGTIKGKWRK